MRKQIDNVNHKAIQPSDDVLEAMHAVMHLVRARQHQSLRDGGQEITPLESRVLAFFARHPGATQRELAEHSGRDKGQLARLLNGMKERGLLEARADAHDRRVTRLHVTEQAQQQYQAVQQQRKHLAAQAVAGMSDQQRQTLLELLLQVQLNLGTAP
jgi:DNA-binding MarR family transcriptional regulator